MAIDWARPGQTLLGDGACDSWSEIYIFSSVKSWPRGSPHVHIYLRVQPTPAYFNEYPTFHPHFVEQKLIEFPERMDISGF